MTFFQIFVSALREAQRRAQERRERRQDRKAGHVGIELTDFQKADAIARVRQELKDSRPRW